MPHFTKRLQTGFGQAEFIFDRLFTGGGVRYHVAVLDNGRKTRIFSMEVSNGKWHIVYTDQTPEWIVELERELSEAIINHNGSSRGWLNAEHESTLTAYVPPAALESLLDCHINTN
jgi:hypothetical protein